MKMTGALAILFGLLLMAFAATSMMNFRQMATSETAPTISNDIQFLAGDLLDDPSGSVKPAELASKIQFRILAIGGFALVLIALGTIMCCFLGKPKEHKHQAPE